MSDTPKCPVWVTDARAHEIREGIRPMTDEERKEWNEYNRQLHLARSKARKNSASKGVELVTCHKCKGLGVTAKGLMCKTCKGTKVLEA